MQLVLELGRKFGKLTVIGLPRKSPHMDDTNKRRSYVSCRCECGSERNVRLDSLVSGLTKSCSKGCFAKIEGENRDGHPIYSSWCAMIQRCHNPNTPNFNDYGGRGIYVCDEWRSDSASFFRWSMAHGWKDGLSIERSNNGLGYDPENCKWATRHDQSRNKRNNIPITAFGETKLLCDWALDPRCAVTYPTLYKRIKVCGWKNPEESISTPSKSCGRSM